MAECERKSWRERKGDLLRLGRDEGMVGVCGILSERPSTNYSLCSFPVLVMALGLALPEPLVIGRLRSKRASCHARDVHGVS